MGRERGMEYDLVFVATGTPVSGACVGWAGQDGVLAPTGVVPSGIGEFVVSLDYCSGHDVVDGCPNGDGTISFSPNVTLPMGPGQGEFAFMVDIAELQSQRSPRDLHPGTAGTSLPRSRDR